MGNMRRQGKNYINTIVKNKILNCGCIKDLFYYNLRSEIDWIKSFKSINNENKYMRRQCGEKDTKDCSYKIKNLIKQLLTYAVLYERKVITIENDQCSRIQM